MKTRSVLILFFLFTVCKLSYATRSLIWNEGSIVLSNKTVLTGDISIEAHHDLVLLRTDGKVNVYPAHRISSLYYFDAAANINRKFVTLADASDGVQFFHLYEIVLKGEVDVLRRLKPLTVELYADANDFDYFIRRDEKLLRLEKFRRKIYPDLLKRSGISLSIYVRENKLDPNDAASAIQIVGYFNRLQKEGAVMARH
jgi:hypothetical protein